MQHPSQIIVPEYEALFASVQIVPSRLAEVNETCERILRHFDAGDYGTVADETGIPFLLIGPSFERESGTDFTRSPAQGDRWNQVSRDVPRGLGPYASWHDAAVAAYKIDGLSAVGAANWTYGLISYYDEAFNGFGYRDYHSERTPYNFGATNLQQDGKYASDGKFVADDMDPQIGCIAMMMVLGTMRPALRLPGLPWPFSAEDAAVTIPTIVPAKTGMIDALDLQKDLNALGYGPLTVDGNFGKISARALRAFQADHGIAVDGIAGGETDDAITTALAAIVGGA